MTIVAISSVVLAVAMQTQPVRGAPMLPVSPTQPELPCDRFSGNSEMLECEENKLEKLEASVARTWRRLERSAKTARLTTSQQHWWKAMVATRRSWGRWKEDHCESSIGPHPGAGLSWSYARARCLRELTQKWLSELRQHLVYFQADLRMMAPPARSAPGPRREPRRRAGRRRCREGRRLSDPQG